VDTPEKTMEDIYDFLGEEHYEHDFESLSNIHREDDLNTYGLGDMHEVRSQLKKTAPPPASVLPPEIIDLYDQNRSRLEFWGTPDIITVTPKVKAPLTKDNSIVFK
jgi:sulfotransferase